MFREGAECAAVLEACAKRVIVRCEYIRGVGNVLSSLHDPAKEGESK